MQSLPDNSNGIPVVVCGIPTVQTEQGIVSPFPYLNSESEMWNGGEEDEGFDEGGGGSIGVRPMFPDEPDLGGDEANEEYEDDDDYDDSDTGFGIGIGLFGIFSPPPLLPA